MNNDFRVATDLPDHPKLRKLARALSVSNVTAAGHLLFLWARVSRQRPDGVLRGWDDDDIAAESGYSSTFDNPESIQNPSKSNPESIQNFAKILEDTGWIEKSSNGKTWQMHDWEEHQSWVIKAPERSMRSKHAANMRRLGVMLRGIYPQCEMQYGSQCCTQCPMQCGGQCPLPFLSFPLLSLPFLSYPNGKRTPYSPPKTGDDDSGGGQSEGREYMCTKCRSITQSLKATRFRTNLNCKYCGERTVHIQWDSAKEVRNDRTN